METIEQEAVVISEPAEVKPSMALQQISSVQEANDRLARLREVVSSYLVDQEDYGTIPGTDKPTLYQPGAQKLCDIYGLRPEYEVKIDKNLDRFWCSYEVKCVLYRKQDGLKWGEGHGQANSYESKWRWREAKRRCPACSQPTIFKSKNGEGWFCWAKRGGCGKTFPEGQPAIEGQKVGRVQNEDIFDQLNTIEKIACKRAFVGAVVASTRSAALFTQDIGDAETVAAAGKTSGLSGDALNLIRALTEPPYTAQELKKGLDWLETTSPSPDSIAKKLAAVRKKALEAIQLEEEEPAVEPEPDSPKKKGKKAKPEPEFSPDCTDAMADLNELIASDRLTPEMAEVAKVALASGIERDILSIHRTIRDRLQAQFMNQDKGKGSLGADRTGD